MWTLSDLSDAQVKNNCDFLTFRSPPPHSLPCLGLWILNPQSPDFSSTGPHNISISVPESPCPPQTPAGNYSLYCSGGKYCQLDCLLKHLRGSLWAGLCAHSQEGVTEGRSFLPRGSSTRQWRPRRIEAKGNQGSACQPLLLACECAYPILAAAASALILHRL